MSQATTQQYDDVVKSCKEIFIDKTKDYGTSWRILRPSSITDQIMIKAKRIRNVDMLNKKKVDEDIDVEFMGIVNYGVIGLIQLELKDNNKMELTLDELSSLYDEQMLVTKKLMEDKNHDYGEAWRDLRISSITDLILMKILRMQQIEENKGKTIISEGVAANYRDIINYAIFALIML